MTNLKRAGIAFAAIAAAAGLLVFQYVLDKGTVASSTRAIIATSGANASTVTSSTISFPGITHTDRLPVWAGIKKAYLQEQVADNRTRDIEE